MTELISQKVYIHYVVIPPTPQQIHVGNKEALSLNFDLSQQSKQNDWVRI